MLIDWKKIALWIYDDLRNILGKSNKKITFWAILVWNNSSSISYIKQKKKWADYVWINFVLKRFEENITTDELLSVISDFNSSDKITWFMVQLPLPKHINTTKIIDSISPLKDVDWFHSKNIWKLVLWDPSWFISCTPAWIMEIFDNQDIELKWKKVSVIWRSNIVWKPIASLLINSWATVTSCNSYTTNLKTITLWSDIIIVAAGLPWLLKPDMVTQASIIIDVWFTILEWKIYWDAETKNIDLMGARITPVPWWVWALTVAMLMKNTLKAWWLIK